MKKYRFTTLRSGQKVAIAATSAEVEIRQKQRARLKRRETTKEAIKYFGWFTLIVTVIALFVACEKEPLYERVEKGTPVTLWTTELNMGWSVLVDGKDIGWINTPYKITKTTEIPLPGDTRFTIIHLNPGTHKYQLIWRQPSYHAASVHLFEVGEEPMVLRIEQ